METNLLLNNNTACPGCPQIIAARTVINTLGKNTIIVNATGCLEITTSKYPNSSWGVPFIHSLFANPASVASGVLAGLKKDDKTTILVQAGDGSTYDIGFGALSAMWNRGDDILYICYDNEIYANTGAQESASTPSGAKTKTTKDNLIDLKRKKNMVDIALAHGVSYVAQTTSAFLTDLKEKVETASKIKGPKYIQILCPCLPGWNVEVKDTVKLAELAAYSGLYPVLEFIDGKLTKKIIIPKPKILVEEYLRPQKRFSNLVKNDQGKKIINHLQAIADENIFKYKLDK